MLVPTTKGDMEESALFKRTGTSSDENEDVSWVEYWLDGELVHRSAHVTLKKMPTLFADVAAVAAPAPT